MHLVEVRRRWEHNTCKTKQSDGYLNLKGKSSSGGLWCMQRFPFRHTHVAYNPFATYHVIVVQTVFEHKQKQVYVSFEAAAACAHRFVTPELTAFYSYLFIYISINLFSEIDFIWSFDWRGAIDSTNNTRNLYNYVNDTCFLGMEREGKHHLGLYCNPYMNTLNMECWP